MCGSISIIYFILFFNSCRHELKRMSICMALFCCILMHVKLNWCPYFYILMNLVILLQKHDAMFDLRAHCNWRETTRLGKLRHARCSSPLCTLVTAAFNLTHWVTSFSQPFLSFHFHIKQRLDEAERGRGASINAASGVWKKISPPSFINLQDIKAEQPRGGRGRGRAHSRRAHRKNKAGIHYGKT